MLCRSSRQPSSQVVACRCVQRQVPMTRAQFIDGCGRPCDHAATFCFRQWKSRSSAGVGGHSSSQQRVGTRLSTVVVMAAMREFSAFSRPIFFALLRVVSEFERQFSELWMAKSSLPSRAPANWTLASCGQTHCVFVNMCQKTTTTTTTTTTTNNHNNPRLRQVW